MKRWMAGALCVVMLGGATACGGTRADASGSASGAPLPVDSTSAVSSIEDVLVGGWTLNTDALSIAENADAKAAFDKAIEALADSGYDYTAISLLGTQVVSGTNYCVLTKVASNDPTADVLATYELVYIYEDLEGNAYVLGTYDLGAALTAEMTAVTDSGEAQGDDTVLVGSYVLNQGDASLDAEENAAVKTAFDKAVAEQSGKTYEPAAYLAEQTVAGSNYCILCRTESDGEDTADTFALVYIYAENDGIAEIFDEEALDISALMDETTSEDSASVSAEDPFTEVTDMDAAAELAGFEMTVPAAEGDYPDTIIRVMEGELIEVLYVNDANETEEGADEAYRIRKGTGEDDISGDYTEYENETTQTIGENTVTLKGDGDSWSVAIWTQDGYAYAVDAQDHPLSLETMTELVQGTK